MLPFRSHSLRCCGFCVVLAWFALIVSTAFGENRHELEVSLRNRLLQRAEAYLVYADQTASSPIVPYVTVIRGLMKSGFSPEHPFLRTKIDALLQMTPSNQYEAVGRHEVILLVRLLRSNDLRMIPPLLERDVLTLQSAIVSDHYNENYRRFGVIRLPRGVAPNRPFDIPSPENDLGNQPVAVSTLPGPFRHSDVGRTPEPALDSVSSSNIGRRRTEIDRPFSFVLIAQTVCLRN